MTFVITQPCVDTRDQTCVDVCPVDCIHFDEDADRMLYIDPVECIDCGACQPACPVTAIFPDNEVPEDQQHFTEINALWYQDADAARARLSGAPAPAPATAAAAPASAAEDEPAEAEEEEAAVEVLAPTQVEAVEPASSEGVIVPRYPLPSPLGLVALAGLVASFVWMWMAPGSQWGNIDFLRVEGPSKAGVLLGIVPALAFLLLFLRSQARDLGDFAARQERRVDGWRDVHADWRRSEETRLHEQARAVQRLAAERFRFPSEEFPNYRTHVNVPEPTMAIEIRGGAEKVFPDIVVVEYPGNYPVMIAQVETAETLTRAQAARVWARLETRQAPLDVYVPASLAGRARDYARAAGIRHIRIRTWRHNPQGVTVREL